LENRILVTGANGNLGSLIFAHLQEQGYEVCGASSNPSRDQISLDFSSSKLNFEYLDNFEFVIHCGRVIDLNNDKARGQEDLFLKNAFQKGCKVVYIGSTSAWLTALSRYGHYKLQGADLVTKNNGIVVSAGLIYGKDFRGQLQKLGRILNKLPFAIQLIPSNFLYLTPVENLCNVILEKGISGPPGSRFLVAHDYPVEFNQILSNLSARSIRFKVKINLVTIRKILKILKFRDSYFNADSVLGLMSPYTENSLEIHRHTLIKTGGFESFD
jgi:hypothetical protein